MSAASQRLEFGPPSPPGSVRALALAMVAHLLLLGALTWGVNWKHQAVTLSAEAELWSAVPKSAAPKLIEVPLPPPPEPVVTPKVIPAPPAPEVTQKLPDADIALERQKQLDKDRLLKAQKQAQLDKLEKLAIDKKLAADKKKAELKQAELKLAEQKQAALAAARKEALKAQEDAQRMEVQRQENIKRMAGLAGATGSASSSGTALQAAGPSSSYAGRIRARVKPNIVFTDDIAGNPTAEVEVRTAPDGTIISNKLLKSSGVRSWDEAVLKAIDKTEVLPRDVDGRVPPSLVISFRPKD